MTGGGFIFGGGSWYGPEFLLAEPIILVTINYRMGPFGFLTLGTDDAPGNVGLLDQRAALTWVRDNIGQFGGDPGVVTMAGESAGSFSATYHMLSPGSSGLYHRVLGQSGVGGLAPGYHHWQPDQATRLANELALLLGCFQLITSNRLECLRETSAVALSLVEFENGVVSQPVDDASYASQPFFPVPVEEAWKTGQFNTEVEVLLGANREEGLLITQAFYLDPAILVALVNKGWDTWGPLGVLMKHYIETTPADSALAHEILETYTGTTADLVTMEHVTNMTDMFTDTHFMYGIHRFLGYHLQHSSSPLFTYVNPHVNTHGQGSWTGVTLPGSSHAAELFLEFSPFLGRNTTLNAEDAQVSLLLTRLWANFVRFGDPSPAGEGVAWGRVEENAGPFFRLGLEPRMEERGQDYQRRMGWWQEWIN